MTDEDLKKHIRARRKDLDRRIASGEVLAPRPLTYDKRGPSVRGLAAFEVERLHAQGVVVTPEKESK